MSFLYPSFLWGLLATAIPIAIHLFNFRRTKKINFSDIRFIQEVDTQSSSFKKLSDLLVLIARILAIVCLVFAFAQPYKPDKNAGNERIGGVTSVYLDNSFSMENESNNRKLLDIAKEQLLKILGQYKVIPNLQFLTNTIFTDDKNLISVADLEDKLTITDFSRNSKTIEEVLQRQRRLAKDISTGVNDYFIFSDFQKSTSGSLSEIKLDSNERLYIVPVGQHVTANLFVDSVWYANPFIREFQNNTLYVRVVNSGNEPIENKALQFYLNDAQAGSADLSMAANSKSIVNFNFSVSGKGIQKGRVALDDPEVNFDNTYYFTLMAAPRIKVLYLTDSPLAISGVNQVYSNDSLFVSDQENASNFDISKLSTNDLVIVGAEISQNTTLQNALSNFASEGGTVVISPSKNASNESGQINVLGLPIHVNSASKSIKVAVPETDIPFFADVFDQSTYKNKSVEMPLVNPVWSLQKRGSSILKLENGGSFLEEISYKKGRIVVIATPINEGGASFVNHALFVPVMYKLAANSVQMRPAAHTFSEEQIKLKLPEGVNTTEVVVRLKQGEVDFIPQQRRVGNDVLYQLPIGEEVTEGGISSGYFEVWLGDKLLEEIGVNYDAKESLLSTYTTDELKQMVTSDERIKVIELDQGLKLQSEFKNSFGGSTWWRYFLLAALFFLFVEIIFLRWIKN